MFYLLSDQYVHERTYPFAEAIRYVLSGAEGLFREGDVMRHMTMLFARGTSFPSHYGTEVGRWDHRYACETEFDDPVPPDAYYAWTDPDLWDYDPHCVLYSKAEFMELFADCCRNYVKAHPERREEFAQAMAANGMSLLADTVPTNSTVR